MPFFKGMTRKAKKKLKKLFSYIVLLIITNFAFSQNYAKLTCVSVNESGYISVNWKLLPNSCGGAFTQYEIYQSSQYANGYNLVGTVNNSSTTSFTLNSLVPTNVVEYICIKTISSCDVISDTLSTIIVSLVNSSGVAKLNWNQNAKVVDDSKFYYINREYPIGSWQVIDSVKGSVTTYSDTLHSCGNSANYKISKTPCLQFSNVVGDVFIDDIAPIKPTLNYVSINSQTNNIEISWNISPSEDVEKYEIIKYNNGWFPIATIEGKYSNFYSYSTSEFNVDVLSFKIRALDSCSVESIFSDEYSTILLKSEYNNCDAFIDLSWNTLVGYTVSKYEIYIKNNNVFELLGTLGGTTNTYKHENVLSNSEYQYYVKSYDESGKNSSKSNVVTVSTIALNSNHVFTANSASVVGYNQIQIKFNLDASDEIKEYKILKSTDSISGFNEIASYSNFPNLLDSITLDDYGIISDFIYYYKLVAYNSCGVLIGESNITNTILLRVDNTSNLKHRLFWKNNNSLQGGVQQFDIYRKIDDGIFEKIDDVSGEKNTYVDDISTMDFTGIEGRFCYLVEAIENVPNHYGNLSSSKSNSYCAAQFPRVFVPNAFTPNDDGNNDVLKPITMFTSAKDYQFIVYNRWGNRVFETTILNQGWDGKYNKKHVDKGVYTYYIHFITSENTIFEDTGTITIF